MIQWILVTDWPRMRGARLVLLGTLDSFKLNTVSELHRIRWGSGIIDVFVSQSFRCFQLAFD